MNELEHVCTVLKLNFSRSGHQADAEQWKDNVQTHEHWSPDERAGAVCEFRHSFMPSNCSLLCLFMFNYSS